MLAPMILMSVIVAGDQPRPNILWITCEDMGPHLGCYGDTYATSPNIDKFAESAMRYKKCWSNAPVCAPARTALISGMYPPSLGAEHMRSLVPFPKGLKLFPQYLRDAGYYCTNNQKEDYNVIKPGKVWDESSRNAHWKKRKEGQPFFAVFNFTTTHESQIRKRPHKLVNDPAKIRIPAYHPDTPEVRHDWAQYYDNITTMDSQFAKVLGEMEAAGLAEDTIVFFFSDHGSGMPRNKRSACNSGLHAPLLVRIPDKFKHLAPKDYQAGGTTDRLVQFVDFGPTMLSLAGVKPLEHFQGKAFMGSFEAEPNKFLFGFRGRMDERYDRVRSVTDGRYVLVLNYMPWLPHGQHNEYMFQTPTTRAWKQLFDQGKLNEKQAAYWTANRKPELYDLDADTDEVTNLLSKGDEANLSRAQKLAQCIIDWQKEIVDIGIMPEAEVHRMCGKESPYDVARVRQQQVYEAIEAASQLTGIAPTRSDPGSQLSSPNPAVRYCALRMFTGTLAETQRDRIAEFIADESPSARIAAAEFLCKHGTAEQQKKALAVLLELAPVKKNGVYISGEALNALSGIGDKAKPGLEAIQRAADGVDEVEQRIRIMPQRLVEKLVEDLSK